MIAAPKEVWILFQDTVGLSNIIDPRTFQVKQFTKEQGWTFEPEQQKELKTMINDRRPDVIIMNPDSSMWEQQVEQDAQTPTQQSDLKQKRHKSHNTELETAVQVFQEQIKTRS